MERPFNQRQTALLESGGMRTPSAREARRRLDPSEAERFWPCGVGRAAGREPGPWAQAAGTEGTQHVSQGGRAPGLTGDTRL